MVRELGEKGSSNASAEETDARSLKSPLQSFFELLSRSSGGGGGGGEGEGEDGSDGVGGRINKSGFVNGLKASLGTAVDVKVLEAAVHDLDPEQRGIDFEDFEQFCLVNFDDLKMAGPVLVSVSNQALAREEAAAPPNLFRKGAASLAMRRNLGGFAGVAAAASAAAAATAQASE